MDERRQGAETSGGLLSDVERALLESLASGQSLQEAVAKLGIDPDAARFQVRSAMGKLNARTEEQAVAIALTSGEIDLTDPPRSG